MLGDATVMSWFRPSFVNTDTEFPNPFFGIETSEDLDLWPSLSPAAKCALRWRWSIRLAARLHKELPAGHLKTVRYEQLLKHPRAVVAELSEFTGVTMSHTLIPARKPAATPLTADQSAEIAKVAGEELRRLGYALFNWGTHPPDPLADHHGRAEHAVRPGEPLGPGHGEAPAQRRAGRRAADRHADLAGLDHPPAVQPAEREPVGVQPERDPPRLAGRQLDPGEAGQPAHRAHHLRDGVAQVQLNDFRAGPVAGVAHGARDLGRSVGRDHRRPDRQVRVLERGVGQAVAERVQRILD